MNIVDFGELAIASIILMVYGWYLGQLHQSGPDIAGILFFFTGLIGYGIAIAIYFLTKKVKWHGHWLMNIITGFVGCGIVFAGIAIFVAFANR